MAAGGAEAVQDIRFARAADGVGIAYAVHGSGPPLLIDACWLSHLQFDWQSPVWRHYLVELGRIATVIRPTRTASGSRPNGPRWSGWTATPSSKPKWRSREASLSASTAQSIDEMRARAPS